MKRKITYCLGYWPIAENEKRKLDYYEYQIFSTLAMLKRKNVIFFTNTEEIIKKIHPYSQKYKINLIPEIVKIEDLSRKKIANKFILQTAKYGADKKIEPSSFNKEKGLAHLWRDYRRTGPDAYEKILSIWLSKVDITIAESEKNQFGSEAIAWIDASISRFNNKRFGWYFLNAPCIDGKITHYPSSMKKNNVNLSINASFLLGHTSTWKKFKTIYSSTLEEIIQEEYPNDEETTLDKIHQKNPELFSCISKNNNINLYQRLLKIIIPERFIK
jgi:hypothetical protein